MLDHDGPTSGADAPPTPRRARAGLVAAGLGAALVLGAILVLSSGREEPRGSPADPSEVPTAQPLEVGDCFDDPGMLDEGEPIPVVPCDVPHDHEVFHTFLYEDGREPPPEDVAIERSNGECIPAFEAFVGVPFEDSELGFFPLEPTARDWRNGERMVRCAILTMDGSKLTGTARNARR